VQDLRAAGIGAAHHLPIDHCSQTKRGRPVVRDHRHSRRPPGKCRVCGWNCYTYCRAPRASFPKQGRRSTAPGRGPLRRRLAGRSYDRRGALGALLPSEARHSRCGRRARACSPVIYSGSITLVNATTLNLMDCAVGGLTARPGRGGAPLLRRRGNQHGAP
jgi:hypothetical protein